MEASDDNQEKAVSLRPIWGWAHVGYPLDVRGKALVVKAKNSDSACIASVIRLFYSIRLLRTDDRTWAFEPVAMWV